jgi:predicted nucleic acid-binding protein
MQPTNDNFFLDSNITLYALNDTGEKGQRALELLQCRPFLSTQVVMEHTNVSVKKFKQPKTRAFENARYLLRICKLMQISEATIEESFRISLRYNFSGWDSLIISSALEAECHTLYSEDLKHGQVIDEKLSIINPFLNT